MKSNLDKRRQVRMMLKAWGNTLSSIEELEREREQFACLAEDAWETLHAQTISDMPKGTSKIDLSDVILRIETRYKKYMRESKRIDREISTLLDKKKRIDGAIKSLSAHEVEILRFRYCNNHSWRRIAHVSNYSEGHARRIEARAVDKLAKRL